MIQPEIMRNFHFYNQATWQEVKPKIRAFIEQFQKQQEIPIQNIEQFYQNLEYDHSFIQWIFPNFYSSRFNSNCYKLTLIERDQMIKSETILKRYHQNYIMILRFFGIELKQVVIKDIQNDDSNKSNNINQQFQSQKQTINIQNIQESKDTQEKYNQINSKVFPQKIINEQIEKQQQLKQKTQQNIKGNNQLQLLQQQFQQLKETNTLNNIQIKNNNQMMDQININYKSELVLIDKNQFELCCLKNTHNLLRLKRILASLSVLKHRKEAIQLCQFLKRELTNLRKIKIYEEYFSGFDRYYEEISDIETNRDENRKFNSYKFCYVDKDLVEQIDISIIQ